MLSASEAIKDIFFFFCHSVVLQDFYAGQGVKIHYLQEKKVE